MNKINIDLVNYTLKKESRTFDLISKVKVNKTLDKMMKERNNKVRTKRILWEKSGRRGAEPKCLDESEMVELLNKHLIFTLFDKEKETRLSVYLPNEGIYTQNERYIYSMIYALEKTYTFHKVTEVINRLTNEIFRTKVREKTRNPNLIATNNGIFNKKTNKLMPFSPKYVFDNKIGTNYVEDAKHPNLNGFNFDEWLLEVANNDRETVQLLWEIINETLNGNYTRQKAFFLIGEGNNGKGTFQDLLINLVGEGNSVNLQIGQFSDKFSLSTAVGKSLIIGDDVPPNEYIKDSSAFKSVVTGDRVSVEEKNKQRYSIRMTPTIIQSSNGMIRSIDKSDGLLRRIVIVPFLADFNGKKENRDIKNVYFKNKELLEYILHKAIKMDFEYFTIPKVSEYALEEFRGDNDPIQEFATDIMNEWQYDRIPKSLVYEVYKMFCEESNYRPISSRKFHKDLLKILAKDKNIKWISKVVKMSHYDAESRCPYEPYRTIKGYSNISNYIEDNNNLSKNDTAGCYVKEIIN